MRVILLHNPKAGSGFPRKTDLLRAFKRAGHQVIYESTKGEGWFRTLENPEGVVAIAGGDGTVGKIASRLIGRNVPIAILPLGSANNIAKAFGLDKPPAQIIRDLSNATPMRFDAGIARGPWGEATFFEAAGAGLFARMMARHAANTERGITDEVQAHGSLQGGRRLLQNVLADLRGREFTLKLGSHRIHGTYLVVEAMNIASIGPAVGLARKADPGDGWLEVVLVRERERKQLEQRLATSSSRKNLSFMVRRVRKLKLSCLATEFHIDDQLWPRCPGKAARVKSPARRIDVEISLFPAALRVLVPG